MNDATDNPDRTPAELRLEQVATSRYTALLVTMLLLFVVFPLTSTAWARLALGLFWTLLLLGALVAVARSRRVLIGGAGLALVVFVLGWLDSSVGLPGWAQIGHRLASLVFLLLTTLFVLGDVVRSGRITTDRLLGSVCVYLLLGLTFAELYQLVLLSDPAAFAQPAGDPIDLRESLIYFSYVTLSTLGYGDVTPKSRLARALASLEALTGQIYLAMLVARLVAMHLAHSAPAEPKASG